MKFSDAWKLVIVVAGLFIAMGAVVSLAGCTPYLEPKSSDLGSYTYPEGKLPAPAPTGSAESRAPVHEVNVIGVVVPEANLVDVVFEQASVDSRYGTGFVSFKLGDAAYERYVRELDSLDTAGIPYDAGPLEVFESEAVMTDAIRAQLAQLNGGKMPEVVFYQIRAIPAPIDGAPPADSPGLPMDIPYTENV